MNVERENSNSHGVIIKIFMLMVSRQSIFAYKFSKKRNAIRIVQICEKNRIIEIFKETDAQNKYA